MGSETELQAATRLHAEARLAHLMAYRGVARAKDELHAAESHEMKTKMDLTLAEQALDKLVLAAARPVPFKAGDLVVSETGVRMVFVEQSGTQCLCEWHDKKADQFRKQWLLATTLRVERASA